MASQLSPGIQVVERVPGFVALQAVATDNGAMLGITERGPVNTPTLITSLEQFRRIFGGPISTSFMFESAQGFFDNGGQRMFVVRVLHYTDITNPATLTGVKASASLDTTAATATAGSETSSNTETFDMAPADTLIVDVDGGGNVTATFDAARATRPGAGATYVALTGLTLIFSIDNGPSQTVTFTGAAVDAATTAAEINAQMSGGFCAVNVGEVDISSDTQGTGSEVDITGGTALAAIGHTVGITTGTGDVVNIDAVTGAEIKTVVEADIPGLTVTVEGSGAITLTSNTTGPASSIQVDATSTLDTVIGFTNALNSGSATSATPTLVVRAASEGAFGNNYAVQSTRRDRTVATTASTITAVGTTEVTLDTTARLSVGDQVLIDDGSDAIRVFITNINGLRIQFASVTPSGTIPIGTDVVLETFDLTFLENGLTISQFVDLRMSDLAGTNFVDNAVTRPSDPEFFFEAVDQGLAPSDTVDPRPDNIASPGTSFTSGSDGGAIVDADVVGSSASGLGLYAYEGVNVNLLCVPGQTTAVVHKGIETYISTFRNTLFAIVEPPIGTTSATGLITYFQTTANIADDNFFPAAPWLSVSDQLNGTAVLVPPSGFVMGLAARVVRRRNIAKAFAGSSDGRLVGVLDVEKEFSKGDYDVIYPERINLILPQPEGILLFGSRTLGFNPADLKQASKRRTMNFIIDTVEQGTRFILFENNDTETRALWRRTVQGFLLQLWRERVLDGNSAGEAFFVICDESNNPPTVVQSGRFVGRIGVRFKGTIEFVEYQFEEDTRAIQEELAAAGLS